MRKFISVLTLVVYLPLATGCARDAITPVHTDPASAAPVLADGESIRISAWIDARGAEHNWNGTVTAVAPDSLDFYRKYGSMRLARSDVQALKTSRPSAWGSIMLGAAALFVVLVFVAARSNPLGESWNIRK